MPLESATYISQLNSANPASSDSVKQGDDHLRLIKSVLQSTFPNLSGAANPTPAEMNTLVGVTSAIQTQLDAKAPTSRTLTAGTGLTGGGDLSADRTLSHDDTSTQPTVTNTGANVIQSVTLDDFGHVTALASQSITPALIGAVNKGGDTLTAGFSATVNDLGTGSGTVVPNPASGNYQKLANGGAFSIGAPTTSTSMVLQVTNGATAGTLSFSGFTFVGGDDLTTVDGDDFLIFITKVDTFSFAYVQALQ